MRPMAAVEVWSHRPDSPHGYGIRLCDNLDHARTFSENLCEDSTTPAFALIVQRDDEDEPYAYGFRKTRAYGLPMGWNDALAVFERR